MAESAFKKSEEASRSHIQLLWPTEKGVVTYALFAAAAGASNALAKPGFTPDLEQYTQRAREVYRGWIKGCTIAHEEPPDYDLYLYMIMDVDISFSFPSLLTPQERGGLTDSIYGLGGSGLIETRKKYDFNTHNPWLMATVQHDPFINKFSIAAALMMPFVDFPSAGAVVDKFAEAQVMLETKGVMINWGVMYAMPYMWMLGKDRQRSIYASRDIKFATIKTRILEANVPKAHFYEQHDEDTGEPYQLYMGREFLAAFAEVRLVHALPELVEPKAAVDVVLRVDARSACMRDLANGWSSCMECFSITAAFAAMKLGIREVAVQHAKRCMAERLTPVKRYHTKMVMSHLLLPVDEF